MEKAFQSVSSLPQPSVAGLLQMQQPGYQYQLSQEELKEDAGTPPNFSGLREQQILDENKTYRDKAKKNIFSKKRTADDDDIQQQVEAIDDKLSDREMDDEETQLLSSETIPITEESKSSNPTPGFVGRDNQMPVPLFAVREEQRIIEPQYDENNVFPDERERNRERSNYQVFLERLRFFAGSNIFTVEQVKNLYEQYEIRVKDRNDLEALSKIADKTKDMTDLEFEEFVFKTPIHRKCHWKIVQMPDGRQQAKIVCDFDQKKKTYLIRE